jgi:hypothetical protein
VAEPISVAWDHNVDPPVPLVIDRVRMDDGFPSLVMRDNNESLRRIWERLEALQDLDAMKVRVAEYLLSVNRDMDGPFIPPTALDWIADGIVRAVGE